MGDPSRVRVTGPLAEFAEGFTGELARLGYKPNAAADQLRVMAHLSRWMDAGRVEAAALTPQVAGEFLAARRAAGYVMWLSPKGLALLLGYLRLLGAVPFPLPVPVTPAGAVLERYRCYLLSERGLAAVTARSYADLVRPFLETREGAGGPGQGQLTAGQVTAFVLAVPTGRPGGTARLTVTALRSLLGFMHVEGLISEPLAQYVPSAASWRLSGLPRDLEPGQVAALLASCDQATVTGRRDFAMLTLLARLGLRAGEVASLTLEDIGWRAGEITIAGKGSRRERLPLPDDAGEAIAGYLRGGRPDPFEGARQVFLRARAPHRGLTTAGVSQAVFAAGQRAGTGPVRAHRLRHSAATGMLRAGAPLTEIGQVLRHRRLLSTAIYAKADTEALRAMARRCRMSPLRQALAGYLTTRRSLGYKLARAEKLLGQLITYLEDADAATVTTEHALAWATLPGGDPRWHADRLTVARRFAIYLRAIDPAAEVPPAGLIPSRPCRATPYLYSDADISALIAAAASLRFPLRAATYQTLIGLLTVTGLRVLSARR